MSCPRPSVCLAPLPSARLHNRTPSILLIGQHQPTLLRCLDGWPRRNGKASALAIQFAEAGQDLAGYAADRFDLAVVQSPSAEQAPRVIAQLVRIARQGLLRF
ncbi:hypothetical protein [Pseudomonas sp. NPDC007930]|uniref:hypothetical protein n=1 Tax=Pseudomonas sp. NPDC007930 TaxID=3364417 RepID=UPI0036F0638F